MINPFWGACSHRHAYSRCDLHLLLSTAQQSLVDWQCPAVGARVRGSIHDYSCNLYVYIHIYTCICNLYVYTYVYVYRYMYMNVYMHIYMHIHIHVHVPIHIHVCIHI